MMTLWKFLAVLLWKMYEQLSSRYAVCTCKNLKNKRNNTNIVEMKINIY